MKLEYWICPNCETQNPLSLKQCEVCDVPNPFLPIIKFCKVSPTQITRGESCTITWDTRNIQKVIINGYKYSKSQGKYSYTPHESGTIDVIFVGNDGEKIHKTVTITVNRKRHPIRDSVLFVAIALLVFVMAVYAHNKADIQRHSQKCEKYIGEADIDSIEKLDSAYIHLNKIKEKGAFLTYYKEKKLLENKAEKSIESLDRKYQKLPNGTTKDMVRKKKERIERILTEL